MELSSGQVSSSEKTDGSINWYANNHYWLLSLYKNPSLVMQAAFLAFLLFTVCRIWRLSGSGIQ